VFDNPKVDHVDVLDGAGHDEVDVDGEQTAIEAFQDLPA
jgi:hypothetical protein